MTDESFSCCKWATKEKEDKKTSFLCTFMEKMIRKTITGSISELQQNKMFLSDMKTLEAAPWRCLTTLIPKLRCFNIWYVNTGFDVEDNCEMTSKKYFGSGSTGKGKIMLKKMQMILFCNLYPTWRSQHVEGQYRTKNLCENGQ